MLLGIIFLNTELNKPHFLSMCCHVAVSVLPLLFSMPWVELWSVMVAFSDHTHLLYVDLSCLYTLPDLFYKLILFYLYMQYVSIVYRICRIDVYKPRQECHLKVTY